MAVGISCAESFRRVVNFVLRRGRMKTLADKLREFEDEVQRDQPDNTDLLRDLSRMIRNLETGAATYAVNEEGEVVEIPA